MKALAARILLIVGFTVSGSTGATLIDRGGGLIYDDVLDITWLQNASPFGESGLATWDEAVMWADTLVFGGFDDWRLPSVSVSSGLPTGLVARPAVPVDCSTATELDCRDNELGYMYYQNLDGVLGEDLSGDQGLIQNISEFPYWSGTEADETFAWPFDFEDGAEVEDFKANPRALWAVRPGDVLTPTLFDRGNGLIYDSVLDITWLQDASLGGLRTWDDAVMWADNLVFGGFDDWRLPSMDVNGDTVVVDCDSMFNPLVTELECRDNELAYMYYQTLNGSFLDDLTGDQGLIQNIELVYWSGTESAPNPVEDAWFFGFVDGIQDDRFGKDLDFVSAWAVRPGDVLTPTPVPAPATGLLLAAGLAGLSLRSRRRQRLVCR